MNILNNVILKISNLHKSYDKFSLKNINLSLDKGQVLGLIGQNGAGKSTIIKSILGLIPYESGTVLVDNQVMTSDNINLKQEMAYVPENVFIYQDVKCKNFCKFVRSCYRNWDDKLFLNLSDKFKLDLNKKIKKLSKGNLVKLLIIIAVSHHPKLLILDEPTSGLDPIIRNQVIDYLRNIVENEKSSILFSSHITEDIYKLADVVTYINDGKILLSEEKEKILKEYKKIIFKIQIPETLKQQNMFIHNNTVITNRYINLKDMGIRPDEYNIENVTLDEVLADLINNERSKNDSVNL